MIRRESLDPVNSSLRIHLCGLGGWRLRKRYLKAFAGARQRIHVAHGYFLPDRGVVRAITAAAAEASRSACCSLGAATSRSRARRRGACIAGCWRRASPSTSGATRFCTRRSRPSTANASCVAGAVAVFNDAGSQPVAWPAP